VRRATFLRKIEQPSPCARFRDVGCEITLCFAGDRRIGRGRRFAFRALPGELRRIDEHARGVQWLGGGRTPLRIDASARRELTPTFSKMWRTCVCTVCGDNLSAVAISFVVRPRTIAWATSPSRGDNPSPAALCQPLRDGWVRSALRRAIGVPHQIHEHRRLMNTGDETLEAVAAMPVGSSISTPDGARLDLPWRE